MENSTHLPFDEWLLSEHSISDYQQQALNEHLQSCEDCRQLKNAWGGVQSMFHAAPQVAPVPGFTSRWMQRQASENLQRQRKQAWIVLSIVSVNALVLFILIALQISSLANSPTNWLLLKAYFLSRIYTVIDFGQSFFGAISQVAFAFPLIGLFFLVGFATFLSVLWFVVYRQLTSQTRRIEL